MCQVVAADKRKTIGCTAVIMKTVRCVIPAVVADNRSYTAREKITRTHPWMFSSHPNSIRPPSALQSNVALPPCMTVSIQLPRKWIHIQLI